MNHRQTKNPLDYLRYGLDASTAPHRNPHRYEVIYTNRYDTVISIAHHDYKAALMYCERVRGMGLGYEPIIKDVSVGERDFDELSRVVEPMVEDMSYA